MKLPISTVNVGGRTRLDLGDIAGLAASIEALGLLHPVVITAGHDLVAGERRLAAMRSLGWTEIPVTIVDIDNAADVFRAELEENTCRLSLSAYEADVLREKREVALAADAKRRQREGQERGRAARNELVSPKLGDTSNAPVTLPGMPPAAPPLVQADEPKARESKKAASIGTGYSGSTLDKVRMIRDAAERGVIKHGRDEVPAPAPVIEIAQKAAENVKKTGVAVERAAAEVRDAIDRHAPAPTKAREALASWRSKFQGAIKRIAKVFGDFDVEQAAENADEELIAELRRTHADLGSYIERVDALRNKHADGLRLVQGGER